MQLCLMIPALSSFELLEHHQELQVQQDHQERICSITQLTPPAHPFQTDLFLFCNFYEWTPPQRVCWVIRTQIIHFPLRVGRLLWLEWDLHVVRHVVLQSQPPLIAYEHESKPGCRDVAFLFHPCHGFCSGCCCWKIPALESKWTWKVSLGFTTKKSVLGSRSSSQWNSLALAELSSLCQCFLFSHGFWNFIFKSNTSIKSELRYTKKL